MQMFLFFILLVYICRQIAEVFALQHWLLLLRLVLYRSWILPSRVFTVVLPGMIWAQVALLLSATCNSLFTDVVIRQAHVFEGVKCLLIHSFSITSLVGFDVDTHRNSFLVNMIISTCRPAARRLNDCCIGVVSIVIVKFDRTVTVLAAETAASFTVAATDTNSILHSRAHFVTHIILMLLYLMRFSI